MLRSRCVAPNAKPDFNQLDLITHLMNGYHS